MHTFRSKYLFNPKTPIFESENVLTFNCTSADTKAKLILLKHLKAIPVVDKNPGILQPLEAPTFAEPMSVYPLVYCVSQIGHINETDAMYILKCMAQNSPKKPLYYVMSPQGICSSSVEGLLPFSSPPLDRLMGSLLGIGPNMQLAQGNAISQNGLDIYRALTGDFNYAELQHMIQGYGWHQCQPEDFVTDETAWIFEGRRKQQGLFGDQYGLAWIPQFGLSRFKQIELQKSPPEQVFLKDYLRKIQFYKNNKNEKIGTIEIFRFVHESACIKLFTQILNQGTLSQFVSAKQQMGQQLTEQNSLPLLSSLVTTMQLLTQSSTFKSHGSMHIKSLFVHDNQIILSEPELITPAKQKKLREHKSNFTYYAPEMKEIINLPHSFFKLDADKFDVWSFGFVLHRVLTREVPLFDAIRKPILTKGLSPGMEELISRCLALTPFLRPKWDELDLNKLPSKPAPRKQRSNSQQLELELNNNSDVTGAFQVPQSPQSKRDILRTLKKGQNMMGEQIPIPEPEDETMNYLSVESSGRFKKIKKAAKVTAIMLLYVFLFFRPFLSNSLDILFIRSLYSAMNVNIVEPSQNLISSPLVSTSTVIASDPTSFLLDEASDGFQQFSNCLINKFDPLDPSYSLLSYIQSGSFLCLICTGWIVCIILCIIKCRSMWKAGIGNQPEKDTIKYYIVYAFHQLSLASLLFAHFYIFSFLYFAGSTPCLKIDKYLGAEPFFDSSIYLFTFNTQGFVSNILATLGLLAILLLVSSCFYAIDPKLDLKYFLSIPSILFRMVPYILFFMMCRIGIFAFFSPTAINDSAKLLPAILTGSSKGFFGLIPEIFVAICVITELLIDKAMNWLLNKKWNSSLLSKETGVKPLNSLRLNESIENLKQLSFANDAPIFSQFD